MSRYWRTPGRAESLERHLRADDHAVAASVGRTANLVGVLPEIDDEGLVGDFDGDFEH